MEWLGGVLWQRYSPFRPANALIWINVGWLSNADRAGPAGWVRLAYNHLCSPSPELSVLSEVPHSNAVQQQRRVQQQWLSALASGARSQQRLAALAVCTSGALLIVQAGAIAWLIQSIVVERLNWVQVIHGFWILTAVLVLRSLLGGVAQTAAGKVADAAKLALREQVYRRLMARGPLWLRRQRTGELGELLLSHGDAIEGYYAGFQRGRGEVGVAGAYCSSPRDLCASSSAMNPCASSTFHGTS